LRHINCRQVKIGQNIDINGNAAGGWNPDPTPSATPGLAWLGVPAWFAWENQGGGIATLRRDGKPEMIVMR